MVRKKRLKDSTVSSAGRTVSAPVQSYSQSDSGSDSSYDEAGNIERDEEQLDTTPSSVQLISEQVGEANNHQYETENDPSNPSSNVQPSTRKRKYSYINRRKGQSQPAKMRKRWQNEVNDMITNIKDMSCCKKLRCFEHSNSSFLESKVVVYRNQSYEQRKLTLFDLKGSNGKYYFDGRPVCNLFLKKAFRFGGDLITSVRNGTITSRQSQSLGSTLQSETTSNSDRGPLQRDSVITFLERMADNCGDKMPDLDEIHLPYFRKRDVYAYFKDEFRILNNSNVKCPTKSYFYRTWKIYNKNIKIRKLGRFAKCTACEQLRKTIHDAAARRDFKSLAIYRRKKAEHNELIAKERREYKKKRDQARLQPDQFLSIIVDGADQSAFGLPHFMIKTKDDRGHSLKVRLIGLLEHNQTNQLRLFTLTEEYPTGANHVIEAIHRFLNERINQSILPRTFFIQVENCTKENKNRFLFSYIESLIRWKLFHEVVVAFLPVGHTHEDIDQTFSRTSDRLRCNDAITLSDLHDELRQVYNDKTTVCAMSNVVNWSGLCEKEKCLTNLKNFSKYRYFKFFKSPESESVSCMIKVNVTDDWIDIKSLSASGTIQSFTKFAPDLARTPPLNINCPEGKEKVTECITAAESRIPSTQKIDELLALRDKVFKERIESFHWDINQCVEMNPSYLLRDNEVDSDGDDITIGPPQATLEDRTVSNDYRYDLNTFVALKTDDNERDTPFWIAKVNKVHRNNDNIISRLTIHWFDKSGKKDVYNCKYFPSYNNITKKSSRTPMKDDVSVNAVLINFESLTKQNRLPAAVSQHLRSI